MIIVVTGTPGVGKHTVANEIIRNLEISLLDINKVAKSSGLFEKNGNTNDVDVEKLEKVLANKIKDPMLIVGHLAPYVILPDKVDKVIVLRKNPYDLLGVYRKRGYTEEKAMENAGSEALGIIAYDSIKKFGKRVFQISISERNIEQSAKLTLDVINGNNYSEEVDWLDTIERNGDLKKFFGD